MLTVSKYLVQGRGRQLCCLIFVLTQVFISQTIGTKICDPGFYLDSATGNCDPCSDICELAKAQRTEERCNEKCPGYAQTCIENYFFDWVTGRCDACDNLCNHSPTSQECKDQCPNWRKVDSKSDSPRAYGNKQGGRMYPGQIAIAICVSVAAVAVVVTVGVVVDRRRRRLDRIGNDNNGYPEGERLTAQGQPLTHPEDQRTNLPKETLV